MPAYLLDKRLQELSIEQLRLSREMNISLLKFFESWSEEQLMALIIQRGKELLTYLARNEAEAYLERSVKDWVGEEISVIALEEVRTDDIALTNYIRKCGFLKFLPEYTKDIKEYNRIINEIDLLSLKLESRALNILAMIHEQQHKQAETINHIGSWIWNLATNKMSWSDELYRIFGLPLQSTIDLEKIYSYSHPDDKETLASSISEAIKTLQPYDFYYRIILEEGLEKVLHAKGSVLAGDYNQPSKVMGTFQDVK
jgi:PAS domain-containing protein